MCDQVLKQQQGVAKLLGSCKHDQFHTRPASAQGAGAISTLLSLPPCVSHWSNPVETNAQGIAQMVLEISSQGNRAEGLRGRVNGKTE